MIEVLVIVAGISAGIGVFGYLVSYLVEHQRRQKMLEQQFRASLLRELRKKGPSRFHFGKFVQQCQVPRAIADRVAQDIYARSCKKVVADGHITESERRQLDSLGRALAIDPQFIKTMDDRAKGERFLEATKNVLVDGRISDVEAAELEQLRRTLGLSREKVSQVTAEITQDAYLALFRRVISDGQITPVELKELQHFQSALALSTEQANQMVRDDALKLYRQWFYSIMQDGEVTDDEEQALAWLEKQFGLDRQSLQIYHSQLHEVKRLAAYRQGNLPSLSTTKLLEGGESCHAQGACCFQWQTATKTKDADGDLLVTSQRLVFSSPVKSFSFAPAKIMDIRLYSNGLEIQTSANRGTGTYFVADARELEAILIGLTRKHKYLLSENYSSNQSRHIPDEVRRAVWDRDGGRCVRCSATDYLEFDHIIPHSRGGASTVNNVRILCRRCNLLKRDRI